MDRFTIIKQLGSGAFGVVVHAKDNVTGKEVAIKQLRLAYANKYMEAEIVNHSLLRHPHIIRFHEVFLTEEHLHIVMEYANGGSLFAKVRAEKRLKEGVARWFFQQVILALDFAHKRGVANRDIKLENLLLHFEKDMPHPLLKICDFGYSKGDLQSVAKSQVGTLSYMAPEVMRSFTPDGSNYDAKKADMWSCGVVLYVMMYGTYPFDVAGEDRALEPNAIRKMLTRMEQQDYQLYSQIPVSADCLSLLRGLLNPDPESRLTLTQVMEHVWFTTKLPPKAYDVQAHYLSLPAPPEYKGREHVVALIGTRPQAA